MIMKITGRIIGMVHEISRHAVTIGLTAPGLLQECFEISTEGESSRKFGGGGQSIRKSGAEAHALRTLARLMKVKECCKSLKVGLFHEDVQCEIAWKWTRDGYAP
jgi:hypothetical protein